MAYYALLLGASRYPKHNDTVLGNTAFLRSHERFREYLRSALCVDEPRMLDLFDSTLNATAQMEEIDEFLRTIPKREDLIVHYVGHGRVTPQQTFLLALAEMKMGLEDSTALRFDGLAACLRKRTLRIYIVLDCCFAAEAVKHLQAPVGDLFVKHAKKVIPSKGIALLAASSKDNAAVAPEGLSQTMFSDAMFRVLEDESLPANTVLTLRQLGELIEQAIQDRFLDGGVLPEVHSPFQPRGDIADEPVFPVIRPLAQPKDVPVKHTDQPLPPASNGTNLAADKPVNLLQLPPSGALGTRRDKPAASSSRRPSMRVTLAVLVIVSVGLVAILAAFWNTTPPPTSSTTNSSSGVVALDGVNSPVPQPSARASQSLDGVIIDGGPPPACDKLPRFRPGGAEFRIFTGRPSSRANAASIAKKFRDLLRDTESLDWVQHVSDPVNATRGAATVQLLLILNVDPALLSSYCDWIARCHWDTGSFPCEERVIARDEAPVQGSRSAAPPSVGKFRSE